MQPGRTHCEIAASREEMRGEPPILEGRCSLTWITCSVPARPQSYLESTGKRSGGTRTLDHIPSIKLAPARNAHRYFERKAIEALRRGGWQALHEIYERKEASP